MKIDVRVVDAKDVVVIGGGTAGVFAAIAAADAGAETLLVEKNSVLGGTMTSGGVNFPGLFFAWGKRILGGHAWEIMQEIMQEGLSDYPEIAYFRKEHWKEQFRINSFATEYVLNKNCKKYGVKLMLHTMLAGIEESETDVELLLCGKEGLFSIKAKMIIDATGDANAVKMAGYRVLQSENLQPASLICKLGNYRPEDIDINSLETIFHVGVEKNLLPEWITFSEFRQKLLSQKGDIHIVCEKNADTSIGKTVMEQKARENVSTMLHFIRTIQGCEHAVVESVASECALRETNRIDGEYMITEEDYVSGRVFDDAICYAYYPVDLHVHGGVTPKHLQDGRIPTIPFRALRPRGSERFLAVGRCVSSDTMANSALRVQVPCMGMGQAAGVAAAVAVRERCNLSEVSFELIKEELNRQDCIVPEKI